MDRQDISRAKSKVGNPTLNTLFPLANPSRHIQCAKLHCLFKIHEINLFFLCFIFRSNALSLIVISDSLQPFIDLLRRHSPLRSSTRPNRITRIPTRHPTPPPRSRMRSIPRNRHERRPPSTSLILRILKLLRER